ncbi:hypothetical protein SapgrDRAFT_1902 [Saprospira grandis DSM 2844]|uniref:Secretion system C-terminal sorting domain-containing protein n=1 Tax=Saprospira grandis DSM 2844 TaxID=694433 RepID=J0P1B8_9BACT|nr:T9SS type A sorting domain-containing protein [Saprospira grandis]EJF53594.1 hypothetical protein SapgrDRAFT_1902 [Saprospira grandis DSM 2844]
MKKPILLFTASLFSLASWAQLPRLEAPDFIEYESQQEADFLLPIAEENSDFSYTGLQAARNLKEVNMEGGTDAYPWLSKDGLRLFWTQTIGGEDQIMQAERPNLEATFGEAKVMGLNLAGLDNMSIWLSADELTALHTVREEGKIDLYFSQRKNKNEEFSTAAAILSLEGVANLEFISAPSLTQDLEELYVYHSGSNGQQILRFKLGAFPGLYQFEDVLIEGADIEPGRLSHDGLRFVCNNAQRELLIFERRSLSEEWVEQEPIPLPSDFSQLAFSDQEMVMVHSYDRLWESNQLHLAKSIFASKSQPLAAENAKELQLQLYPHPVQQRFTVAPLLPQEASLERAELYGLGGQKLREFPLEGQAAQYEFDLGNLPSGSYILRLSGQGFLPVSQLVIKQ